MDKKISIVIFCHNFEDKIENCIVNINKNTYKNLELILLDNSNYDVSIHQNVKKLKIENTIESIINSIKQSTGEYITFIRACDTVDMDYFRDLMNKLEDTNSDISVANVVNVEGEKSYSYTAFNLLNRELNTEEILNNLIVMQEKNPKLNTYLGKLYKKDVLVKSIKGLEKISTKDITQNTFPILLIIMSNATKLALSDYSKYYYNILEHSHKGLKNTKKEIFDEIEVQKEILNICERYLKDNDILDKYSKKIEEYKVARVSDIKEKIEKYIDKLIFNKEKEKNKLIEKLSELDSQIKNRNIVTKNSYYYLTADDNKELEKLKKDIYDADVVSFDMFDTLITRPFLDPKDLFKLMNKEFNEMFDSNGLMLFSMLREDAESYARKIKNYQEVTLDEIYDYIVDLYKLDRKKVLKLKELEIELEYKFCKRRNNAYYLYELAKHLNKKVIVTSDMYLPHNVIEKILKDNGYEELDKIFLSNEYSASKSDGTLFKYLLEEYKDKNILHIGDNYISDVEMANQNNIKGFFYPKCTDVFLGFTENENKVNNCGDLYEYFKILNISHEQYLSILSVRSAIAIIANKYFDNPFRIFNSESDFNADPYFIGYYALGMHNFAMVKWIFDDVSKKKFDSLSFMARDGYVPYLSAQDMIKIYDLDDLKLNYTYLSRKCSFPLILKEYKDLYKFKEYFYLHETTVKKAIQVVSVVCNLPDNYEEILKENGFLMNETFEDLKKYNSLMQLIWDKFYSKEKYEQNIKNAKEYLATQFTGKAATFDVGYSGRPELIISNLLKKPITTYFVHTTSDEGYINSNLAGYDLNCFYQYAPVFSGTLREHLISASSPTCVGYTRKDKEVVPVFGNEEEYTFFDRQVLDNIQKGAVDFTRDIVEIFGKDLHEMRCSNYYLSLPYEYFLHYSRDVDRKIFKGLMWESNVDEVIEMNEFWSGRLKEYNSKFNLCKK